MHLDCRGPDRFENSRHVRRTWGRLPYLRAFLFCLITLLVSKSLSNGIERKERIERNS